MKITAHYPTLDPDILSLLHESLNALAENCDGANIRDHRGFNRNDTDYGKYMSSKDWQEWTYQESFEVWRMLRKYHTQLLDYDIDLQGLRFL